MVDLGNRLGLGFVLIHRRRIRARFLLEDFERHLTARVGIQSLENRGRPTFGNQFKDLKTVDVAPSHELHSTSRTRHAGENLNPRHVHHLATVRTTFEHHHFGAG